MKIGPEMKSCLRSWLGKVWIISIRCFPSWTLSPGGHSQGRMHCGKYGCESPRGLAGWERRSHTFLHWNRKILCGNYCRLTLFELFGAIFLFT